MQKRTQSRERSPSWSDAEDASHSRSKRPRLESSSSAFQTPEPALGARSVPAARPAPHTLAAMSQDDGSGEDPFAAPSNGRLVLGQGHGRMPRDDSMTYVFRGKKVRGSRPMGDDAEEDRLLASIKPKLLFPSALPPAPPVDMTPIRTPQKASKPAGPYMTPQSLARPARTHKLSQGSQGDSSDGDPFGGGAPHAKVTRDWSLAKRAGGSSSTGMLWE